MLKTLSINSTANINTILRIPGDKSISHRSVILGSLANGKTRITNFLESEDCLHTLDCFSKMGVTVERNLESREVAITGKGLYGLEAPRETLYVGNSGTGIRLMLGILAAQKFDTVITGDESICGRPMARVVDPLLLMGADIKPALGSEKMLAPLQIRGNRIINGITYNMPMASAQVKSAIMLAALYTKDKTIILEPGPARDHTERMLRRFGIPVEVDGNMITITGGQDLSGQLVEVPSDISSAAFFLVAGAIVPGSRIMLPAIGINPTRTGILDVLKAMGADIKITNIRNEAFEPVADLEVVTSHLRGISLEGNMIPRIIDEIPIIAVAAAAANGRTEISGAEELRFKESDRIATVCRELSKLGVNIQEKPDGLIIDGDPAKLAGAICDSHGDHRIAMSCAVLGLIAKGKTVINNVDCINTSFPEFFTLFDALQQ